MKPIQSLFQGMQYLFFPRICCTCAEPLSKNETHFCLNCLIDLPYTHFEKQENNPAIQRMWGRFPFQYGTSVFHFSKQSIIQNLLHQIKYGGDPELVEFMGEKMGLRLENTPFTTFPDLIVPVPIHPLKEQKRGYNQSDLLCKGISKVSHIEYRTDLLVRKSLSESQTKKNRSDRWENVATEFELNKKIKISNKHILLVDDVMTTGATIEACAIALQQIPGITISFATLAIAEI